MMILGSFPHLYNIVNIWAVHQYDQAPYSITVELENITINQGEDLVLLIGIQAEEGFNSTVELELEIYFVGYNLSMNLFPLYPPFPRMQEAIIEIPQLADGGGAMGVLKASSGEYVLEQEFQFNLVDEEAGAFEEYADIQQEQREEEARVLLLILEAKERLLEMCYKMIQYASRTARQLLSATSRD